MKTLFKDWKDLLWYPQIEFMKKHWIFMISIYLIDAIWILSMFYRCEIMDFLDTTMKKIKRIW